MSSLRGPSGDRLEWVGSARRLEWCGGKTCVGRLHEARVVRLQDPRRPPARGSSGAAARPASAACTRLEWCGGKTCVGRLHKARAGAAARPASAACTRLEWCGGKTRVGPPARGSSGAAARPCVGRLHKARVVRLQDLRRPPAQGSSGAAAHDPLRSFCARDELRRAGPLGAASLAVGRRSRRGARSASAEGARGHEAVELAQVRADQGRVFAEGLSATKRTAGRSVVFVEDGGHRHL